MAVRQEHYWVSSIRPSLSSLETLLPCLKIIVHNLNIKNFVRPFQTFNGMAFKLTVW